MGDPSCKKVPPHPFQEISHENYLNRVVSAPIDGRREVNLAFANAIWQGPPRPYQIGGVFCRGTGCQGCHPLQGKTKAYHKTNNQPVILSEVEVLRVERKRTSKTEERRDEGIYERVWVAFCSKCNIPLASHRNFKRDPASPVGSRFFLATRSEKLRLRSG